MAYKMHSLLIIIRSAKRWFENCNVSLLFLTKIGKRYFRRLSFAQIRPKAFAINE